MKNKIIILPMLILLMLCALGILLLSGSGEKLLVSEHHFAFVPDTILQVLDSGENDAFSLVRLEASNDVWLGIEPYPYPVMWDQSEYLKIADAVHQLIWNEPVSEWSLKSMGFNLSCADANMGLQAAFFEFSRNEVSLTGVSRTEHQIYIYPRRGLIDAWEWLYRGEYDISSSVRLSHISISAKDALVIAEKNGGAIYRSHDVDACDISIILSRKFNSYRWDVQYSPSYFEILIDTNTGEIIR